MANGFVTNGSALPGTKVGGPNPAVATNAQVTGAEFNELTGALSDIRTYINQTANLQTNGGDATGSTDCHAAFVAALAAISNVGTIVIPQGTYLLGTNTAIPAGVVLRFLSGASINVGSGKALTINGAIDAPDNQAIFTYASTTIAGVPGVATQPVVVPDAAPCRYLTPYHFGAAGDGVTDDQLALNVCANATTRMFLPPGNFVPIAKPIVCGLTKHHVWGTGSASIITYSPVTGANPTYPNWTGGTVNSFQTGVLVFADNTASSQQQFIEVDHIQFVGNKNIYTTNNQINFAYVANMIYLAPSGNVSGGGYTSATDVTVHDCLFQHGQLDVCWGETANRFSFCDNTIIDWGYLTDSNHPGTLANLNVLQATCWEGIICRNNLYQVGGGFGLSGAFMTCCDNVVDEYLTTAIYPADQDNIRAWTIDNNIVRTTMTHNQGTVNYNATALVAGDATPGSFSLPQTTIKITPLAVPTTTLFPTGGGTIYVVSGAGVQTVTYGAFDGSSVFTGCSGGTGVVSVGAALYTGATIPIGLYAGIQMGPDDGAPTDPMPQGLVITGNLVWFDDDNGSHTAPYGTGIQISDASATVANNEIVYNLSASVTSGGNMRGVYCTQVEYNPVIHISTNKVTFVQTGATPNMNECNGFVAALQGPSLLLTIHSSNNKVVGLAPSGNTGVGNAFNYSAVDAGTDGDLLCFMSGDFADGGLILNGTIGGIVGMPNELATDSRSANSNPNKRADMLAWPAPVTASAYAYIMAFEPTGQIRRSILAGYRANAQLVSGTVTVTDTRVTQFSTVIATHSGDAGTAADYGVLYPVQVTSTWVAGTAYTAGSFVVNSANRLYQCAHSGTSGSTGPVNTSGTVAESGSSGGLTWTWIANSRAAGYTITSTNSSDADLVVVEVHPGEGLMQ